MTRTEMLDKVKTLVEASRELSAEAPNPFDQVSGTPALDNLKLNGQVISDEDLGKLLGAVEKAKTDDEMWGKVAGVVGKLVNNLAGVALL